MILVKHQIVVEVGWFGFVAGIILLSVSFLWQSTDQAQRNNNLLRIYVYTMMLNLLLRPQIAQQTRFKIILVTVLVLDIVIEILFLIHAIKEHMEEEAEDNMASA